MKRRELPAEHKEMLDELERSYLSETDPIGASGFGGGPARWRAEREPILDAITSSGSLLDVGCANGHLLDCLMKWGAERGLALVPHGVDRSEGLIERARALLPDFAENLHVGDSWTWIPPTQCDYVYALHDCVPLDYLPEYVDRLMRFAVAEGGRLILGAYGSLSRGLKPYDVRGFLESRGYAVAGSSEGGSPAVSLFAWTDRTACAR
jgi:SAM-dependent methyltransferase